MVRCWWLCGVAIAALACGCAQVVGLEQDSYLVDSDPAASSATGQGADSGAGGSGGGGGSALGADAASPGQGPWCGNSFCDWSEDKSTCPGDCLPYTCGNHACEAGEDVDTCEKDCGPSALCGDDVCEPSLGETDYNCPDDCAPPDGG